MGPVAAFSSRPTAPRPSSGRKQLGITMGVAGDAGRAEITAAQLQPLPATPRLAGVEFTPPMCRLANRGDSRQTAMLHRWAAPWLTLLVLPLAVRASIGDSTDAAAACTDAPSCAARVSAIAEDLDAIGADMKVQRDTITALEGIRSGFMDGGRVAMPSAQRQYLQQAAPWIGEISCDIRHTAVSTNASANLTLKRRIADKSVRLMSWAPLTMEHSLLYGDWAGDPDGVLVTFDSQSRLSIHRMTDEILVDHVDIGHGDGRTVKDFTLASREDEHMLATIDDASNVRIHGLKVVLLRRTKKSNATMAPAPKLEPLGGRKKAPPFKRLGIVVTFALAPALPVGPGEERMITAVIPTMPRGSTFIVVGDSLGALTVMTEKGVLKGRMQVTQDPGGIKGFRRGNSDQSQVLFFSSHSFGFFTVSKVDVRNAPCTGWQSPLFEVASDPSFVYAKAYAALVDGDVLVFESPRKDCELVSKFPRVSSLPMRVHLWRGYLFGLPQTVSTGDASERTIPPELFLFNLAIIENGIGGEQSGAVALQVAFGSDSIEAFALHGNYIGGDGDKAISQLALRFADPRETELYELRVEKPKIGKDSGIISQYLTSLLAVSAMIALFLWWRRWKKSKAAQKFKFSGK
eukprot:TRINITY_DN62453_c0_g1_i1.p1 TRINITY_DN62453_c0_g1~~TRINITY_DN62453_c0_g1_i1.p1  ORF type:complete len:632 (+),score=100.52 TRINITY_DN62453_c0_g1_i1:154-2049(+)